MTRKAHTRFTLALLFTLLALLTFFGTNFLSTAIDMLYRNASGLATVRNVAQIAAEVAVIGALITAAIVTVAAALRPANLLLKLIYTVPLFLLVLLIAGIVSGLLGVGTFGNWFNLQGIGGFTFASAWLAFAALLAAIALVIAAARTPLSRAQSRIAVRSTSIAALLTIIAAVALAISVVIVSTSEPSSFGRPEGGFPPGEQVSPGAGGVPAVGNQDQAPPSTAETPSGLAAPPSDNAAVPQGQASATTEAPSGFSGNQDRGGFPGGEPPQGGFPEGGPGGFGNSADTASHYTIGGVVMLVFSLIALVAAGGMLIAVRRAPAASEESVVAVSYRREIGLGVFSFVILGVVFFVAIQFVPVTRDNPPVTTTLNWDSEQTRDLAYSACMDCHSNETTWPWYASIAPSSWLTTLHVNDGRAELNFSELDSLPVFRKSRLAEQIAEQIRSGTMPPADYQIMHPDAQLTDAEKEQLIQGFQNALDGS